MQTWWSSFVRIFCAFGNTQINISNFTQRIQLHQLRFFLYFASSPFSSFSTHFILYPFFSTVYGVWQMWTEFSVVNMIVVTITTTFNWEQLRSFSVRRVCMCEFFLPLPAFWNLGIPFLNCYNQVQSKQIPLWLAEGFNYLFSFRSFAFYSHHFWTNILHITRTRTQPQPQPHTCTNTYTFTHILLSYIHTHKHNLSHLFITNPFTKRTDPMSK